MLKRLEDNAEIIGAVGPGTGQAGREAVHAVGGDGWEQGQPQVLYSVTAWSCIQQWISTRHPGYILRTDRPSHLPCLGPHNHTAQCALSCLTLHGEPHCRLRTESRKVPRVGNLGKPDPEREMLAQAQRHCSDCCLPNLESRAKVSPSLLRGKRLGEVRVLGLKKCS